MKVTNVERMISSPMTEQRFACRVIDKNDSTSLVTLGPKRKRVECASGPSTKDIQRNTVFSVADMSTIQKDLSLSNLQTYKLAEDMRLALGSRKIIESHLKEKLYAI